MYTKAPGSAIAIRIPLAQTRHPLTPPLKTGCGDDRGSVHAFDDPRHAYGSMAVSRHVNEQEMEDAITVRITLWMRQGIPSLREGRLYSVRPMSADFRPCLPPPPLPVDLNDGKHALLTKK
jgi:hypothetical protein